MRSLYQARGASRRLGVLSVIRGSFAKLPILLVVLAVAGSTSTALGQATSGSISGFVTDGSGAAIPQAKVSVQDEGTGVSTQATTDGSGFYNVTHIIAGDYTVTVTANG